MGLLSLFGGAKGVSDGAQLKRQLDETMQYISSLNDIARTTLLDQFVQIYISIEPQLNETSTSNALDIARKMGLDARRLSRYNEIEACALWLVHALIVSIVEKSNDLKDVYSCIDDLLQQVRRDNYRRGKPAELWEIASESKAEIPQYKLAEEYDFAPIIDLAIAFYKDVPYKDKSSRYREDPLAAVAFPTKGGKRPFYWVLRKDLNNTLNLELISATGNRNVLQADAVNLRDEQMFVMIVLNYAELINV